MLPLQNFVAMDIMLLGPPLTFGAGAPQTRVPSGRRFCILDTSPMMLSRADATFDGTHFCLPGPMDFWSRMLYYQMERDRFGK